MLVMFIIVLAAALAAVTVTLNQKIYVAREDLVAARRKIQTLTEMIAEPFGKAAFEAVAAQVQLTPEVAIAAFVTAAVAGKKNTVAGEIADERVDIADEVAYNAAEVAALQSQITALQDNTVAALKRDATLLGYAALLPLPPAPAK